MRKKKAISIALVLALVMSLAQISAFAAEPVSDTKEPVSEEVISDEADSNQETEGEDSKKKDSEKKESEEKDSKSEENKADPQKEESGRNDAQKETNGGGSFDEKESAGSGSGQSTAAGEKGSETEKKDEDPDKTQTGSGNSVTEDTEGDQNAAGNALSQDVETEGGSTAQTPEAGQQGTEPEPAPVFKGMLGAAPGGSKDANQEPEYVLMNIPYNEFYEEELADGSASVDAVSSSTRSKPLNEKLAGGSYHVDSDGSDITGVTFPVRIKDSGFTPDDSKKADSEGDLFGAGSYAWMPLVEEPSVYKQLSFKDNSMDFSAVSGNKASGEMTADVKVNGSHTYYEINNISTDPDVFANGDKIRGVVLTDDSGNTYGLRHLSNIWNGRAVEIGFEADDVFGALIGHKITGVKYYTTEKIYDLSTEIEIPEKLPEYVLMNLPYADFYSAEITNGDSAVDAVASATMKKPLNTTLAAGSYHVNEDGSDITGITYPVKVGKGFVPDPALKAENEEALFGAASYAWVPLEEAPSYYKEIRVGHGRTTIGAVQGEVTSVDGATAVISYNARHADVEISLQGTTGIERRETAVSGMVVTTEDGKQYPMRHLANIWLGTEFGFNYSDAAGEIYGKKITNIRYYTKNAVIDFPVDIDVNGEGYVLMNIPYADFYEAEGVSGVDSVSSATQSKPLAGNLAGGSYHVNEDGSDITGIIYPVKVSDFRALKENGNTVVTNRDSFSITVKLRGQEVTTEYKGKDALFQRPSYSYYVLAEEPAYYKEMTLADGTYTFGPVQGQVTTVDGAEGNVTIGARHANVEISLEGTDGIEKGAPVSGVIITTSDKEQYALRHIANIWRATEIGWNFGDNDIYPEGSAEGKTITNVRYYTQDAVIDYPVNIKLELSITASATDAQTAYIAGLPGNIADARATVTTGEGESAVTMAADAAVEKGSVALDREMEDGTEYTVTVTSSNYPALTAVYTYQANRTELNQEAATGDQLAKTLAPADYTDASWKAFTDALAAAKAVQADEKATQSEIDGAAAALKAAIDALEKKPVEKQEQNVVAYKIIKGAGSTWAKGGKEGLLIASDAPFAKFDSVVIDGSIVAGGKYSAKEGSTEITLTPAYLEDLIVGTHSIVIQSTDGSASTTFAITEALVTGDTDSSAAEDSSSSSSKKSSSSSKKSSSSKSSSSSSGKSSPRTGDDNGGRIALYTVLILLSAAAVVFLYRKKKNAA